MVKQVAVIKYDKDNLDWAVIYVDFQWEEYRVVFYKGGKVVRGADYHTDDYDDARGTAQCELARMATK